MRVYKKIGEALTEDILNSLSKDNIKVSDCWDSRMIMVQYEWEKKGVLSKIK